MRSAAPAPAPKQATHAAMKAAPAPSGRTQLVDMQRRLGNRGMQRALRLAIQPKLLINKPGDALEQEADRVADHAVQRKCACSGGQECPSCAADDEKRFGSPLALHRFPSAGAAPALAPRSVERVLQGQGQPLPEPLRNDMEANLGADFQKVRLHDNAEAHNSAQDISARAYTVGNHVVFARGQFHTNSVEGRRLLAHELVHVMQQNGTRQATPGSPALAVSTAPASVQREPADSLGWVGDTALEAVLGASMLPPPLRSAAAASVRGFIGEAGTQFSKNSDSIWEHIKQLKSPSNLKSLIGGYYGGLLAGIVSPLTGLFDLLVFADRLRVLIDHITSDASNRFAGLVQDAKEVGSGILKAVGDIKAELLKLKADPIGLIVALVSDQGPSRLDAIANKAGHDAVKSLAQSVEKRFSPDKQEPEKHEAEEAPLAQADAKIEQFKESLFSTPWAKTGYDIGYAVGFTVVNILLLVFSGGVGTVLTRLGGALSEVGGALGKVGKLVVVVGRAIHFVEEAVNAVMSIALKPLKPLLRALEPHFEALVKFLQKLFGIAEKESAEALAAAAKTTAAVSKPKLPAPHLPSPHAPAPHAPAVHAPAVHAPAPHAPAPSAPTVHAPAPHPPAPHAPAPHAQAPEIHSPGAAHPSTPKASAGGPPAPEPHPAPAAKPKPAAHEPHLSSEETKALEQSRHLESLNEAMIDNELKAASKVPSQASKEAGYVEEKVLPNGHTWRKQPEPPGGWCRFSKKPSLCVGPNALEEFKLRGGVPQKIPPQPTPPPEFTAVPKQAEHLPPRTDEIRDRPNMDLRKVRAKRPSEALADALEAKGKPRPAGHEAHHIVPEGAKGAERAREILRTQNIGVNTVDNGVWLRGRQLGVQTESFGSHLGIHTPEYIAGVTELLEQAQKTGTVRETLQSIGEMLEAGKIQEILNIGKKALKGR